jgi:predicted lysophospholipase L1 biosynthesis ABC-type transport system permease subunit
MIINRALARKYWPRQDPTGERITIGTGAGQNLEDVSRVIVGVVDDVREADVNREPAPAVFVPLDQVSDAMTARNNRVFPLTWLFRTRGEPSKVAGLVSRELREASGGLPVARVRTLDEVIDAATARTTFATTLLTAFAAIALLLAVVGLYGLMSYSVEQRTQEIGIRLALGAVPANVRNMVLLDGARLALLGVSLGVIAALALTRLMVSLIFGVKTWDPLVFASVAGLLNAVAFVASWVPARRATRVDPLVALRRARPHMFCGQASPPARSPPAC